MFLPALFILTIGFGASLGATYACRRRLAQALPMSLWRTEIAGALGGGSTALLLLMIALPAQAYAGVMEMLPVVIPAAALLALPAAHAVFKLENGIAGQQSPTESAKPMTTHFVWCQLWRQQSDMLITTFLIWLFAVGFAIFAPEFERHALTSFFLALGCLPLNGAVGFITAWGIDVGRGRTGAEGSNRQR